MSEKIDTAFNALLEDISLPERARTSREYLMFPEAK